MKVLVTGACGFIGFHLCLKLLKNNFRIIGIDKKHTKNILRKDRLKILKKFKNFRYIDKDLSINKSLNIKEKVNFVIHLAAKPGVRESIRKPRLYFDNNVLAFFNIIDFVREKKIDYFIYASSSSVYGNLKNKSAKENEENLNPLSFYAVTKQINEIIAKNYYQIHKVKSIGLRFFSVYGSYGRSDMAYYKFPLQIKKNHTIKLNNSGNDQRDFTHVDDITDGIFKIIKRINNIKKFPILLNFGSNKPLKVKKIISMLEKNLSKKIKLALSRKNYLDPDKTNADITRAKKLIKYKTNIKFEKGYKDFIDWFKNYHNFK